ncbi:MAG: response regulator transcription factor [Acidobacteria bacterium]|nr:response regulator transcription factor [Acidobacteriota bacterium]
MIRIVIAAPARFYREGIALILRDHARICVVGLAATAIQTVEVCANTRPDVVVLDWSMESCLDAVRNLATSVPSCKPVLLAVPDTESDLMACAEAGVHGYVTRESATDSLSRIIEATAGDELHCSSNFAYLLMKRVGQLAAQSRNASAAPLLTPREIEVLRQVEQGSSNKEIATHLGIEVATVKNHIHNLLEKLPARSRSEAAAMYRRWNASA